MVTLDDIRKAVYDAGITGKAVCVHSSLKSFGHVEGGPRTVIDGLLAEGCTVMAPTFVSTFWAKPRPDSRRIERNAYNYDAIFNSWKCDKIYTPESNDVDEVFIGAIPAALLKINGRQRGNHPLDSFAAVGPLAETLISCQTPVNIYAPFKALVENDGCIVLMGVDLNRMTFIHYAEQMSGRNLFVRWGNTSAGMSIESYVGGCSEGFRNLEPALRPIRRDVQVGKSRWLIFPAKEALSALVDAIHADPQITHCPDPDCIRCRDAIAGGPILEV